MNEYWTAGPVAYERRKDGVLVPRTVHPDPSLYNDGAGTDGWADLNPASADGQYRPLQIHLAVAQPDSQGNAGQGGVDIVGRFDPGKLPHLSPLSQVPLETYNPPVAQAADAASKQILGDAPYRPTLNLGGYLLQPPQLLTTISGIQGFTSAKYYKDGSDNAFISVIRVRVAGVTGTDNLSITGSRRSLPRSIAGPAWTSTLRRLLAAAAGRSAAQEPVWHTGVVAARELGGKRRFARDPVRDRPQEHHPAGHDPARHRRVPAQRGRRRRPRQTQRAGDAVVPGLASAAGSRIGTR